MEEVMVLIFKDRKHAEEVLSNARQSLALYGNVTVADVLNDAGYDDKDYTAKASWEGWTDLSEATIEPNGYALVVPAPEKL